MSGVYYNEFDPKKASILKQLIFEGLIPRGEVDERSIVDVQWSDIREYTQWHFFAGIGGWPLAFRLSGWPDNRPVCSASVPCPSYSRANPKAKGQDDERHLLPDLTRIVGQSDIPVCFGEQVVGAVEFGWLDQCFESFETEGYACGASVLFAKSFGARHLRERLFWVADADEERREGRKQDKCPSIGASQAFPQHGNPLADAWRALDADSRYLLPRDGISVGMVRSILAGFGDAIVPQVASQFIAAYMDCRP